VEMAYEDVIDFAESYPVSPELHLCAFSAVN